MFLWQREVLLSEADAEQSRETRHGGAGDWVLTLPPVRCGVDRTVYLALSAFAFSSLKWAQQQDGPNSFVWFCFFGQNELVEENVCRVIGT